MTKYRFIGEGAGIPGLPHEITDEEAKTQGVADILAEAVRNGNYVALDASEKPAARKAEKVKETH